MIGHNERCVVASAEERLSRLRSLMAAAVFACEGLDRRGQRLLSSVLYEASEQLDEASQILEGLSVTPFRHTNLAERILSG